MNNSFFTQEATRNQGLAKSEAVKDREALLVKTVDSVRKVLESEGWSSLKTLVFDQREEELKKQLFSEARKDKPDALVLAKLNGRYEEVRFAARLKEHADKLLAELNTLRKNYGKDTEQPESFTGFPDGAGHGS